MTRKSCAVIVGLLAAVCAACDEGVGTAPTGNFVGPNMTFTADVSDLKAQPGPCGGNWDDCISSLQIRQR